jgi:hypothetical protein
MVRAGNQHAGDTGRSHLANRYFLGALHRGWPLDELDETEAARRASNLEGAPGRPNCARGANQFGWDDNTTDVGALDRNRVMPPHSIRFDYIIFKRCAFRVRSHRASGRGNLIGKNLEVVGVADLLAGVDIDPNGLSSVPLQLPLSPVHFFTVS